MNTKPPEGLVTKAFAELERADSVPAFQLLKPGILESLKDVERTRASIVEDGLSPDALIYLLVSNEANRLLCSGKYHIYRGVLSGTGHQVLSAFVKASEMMVQLGTQSQEVHDQDVRDLRKEIKQIG